jgi:hypothetical protein
MEGRDRRCIGVEEKPFFPAFARQGKKKIHMFKTTLFRDFFNE